MQKIASLLLAVLFCFLSGAFPAYADSQPANLPLSGGPMVNLNSDNMEKLLKAEEAFLKRVKMNHVRQERKLHQFETKEAYQEAIGLYHLQRPDQAKEIFSQVKTLSPYYKSTDVFLKTLDNQVDNKVIPESAVSQQSTNSQMAIDLAREASMLYRQAVDLGDNPDTVIVKNKLNKLRNVFQDNSQNAYIHKQLKRIIKEADQYDQEIFRLTQEGKYLDAQQKMIDFQQVMIDEFRAIKENIVHINERYQDIAKYTSND